MYFMWWWLQKARSENRIVCSLDMRHINEGEKNERIGSKIYFPSTQQWILNVFFFFLEEEMLVINVAWNNFRSNRNCCFFFLLLSSA